MHALRAAGHLVFWIEHLIPGVGRQVFVNPEHKQKASLGFRANVWVPGVSVGTRGEVWPSLSAARDNDKGSIR